MGNNDPPNQATRTLRWLATDPSRRARLRDSLGVFDVRLAEYKNNGVDKNSPWVQACDACVSEVNHALKFRDLDRGWAFLHEAERHEVDGLEGAALFARATAIRFEAASKLSDWRKDSSAVILELSAAMGGEIQVKREKKKARPDAILRYRLKEALRIRDEHFFNVYRKTAMQSELLILTALILAFILTALIALADDNRSDLLGTRDELVRAMMYGVLGAVISTAVSLAEGTATKKRIPDHLATTYATLARPFFGAGFGVAAYIAMRSGVVNVFGGRPEGIAFGCVLA
jgi:hypothetical protein